MCLLRLSTHPWEVCKIGWDLGSVPQIGDHLRMSGYGDQWRGVDNLAKSSAWVHAQASLLMGTVEIMYHSHPHMTSDLVARLCLYTSQECLFTKDRYMREAADHVLIEALEPGWDTDNATMIMREVILNSMAQTCNDNAIVNHGRLLVCMYVISTNWGSDLIANKNEIWDWIVMLLWQERKCLWLCHGWNYFYRQWWCCMQSHQSQEQERKQWVFKTLRWQPWQLSKRILQPQWQLFLADKGSSRTYKAVKSHLLSSTHWHIHRPSPINHWCCPKHIGDSTAWLIFQKQSFHIAKC